MPVEQSPADDRRLIFLTGAPLSSALLWDENHLSTSVLEAFEERSFHEQTISATSSEQPAWRLVSLQSKHLPSGLTQASDGSGQVPTDTYFGDEETSFLTATDLSLLPDDSRQPDDQVPLSSDVGSADVLTQFYDHSFTVHDEVPASHVFTVASQDRSSEDLECHTVEPATELQAPPIARPQPRSRHLSTLRDIPNAAYLHSLEPQTMTVDLVVGILQISQPQWIKTRKYSGWAELVEMMVADEVKAGFGITIWLPPAKTSKALKAKENDHIRSKVTSLRPRDIVLVKNVALKTFRSKVHGQSMRSANTSLDLLYRSVLDSYDQPGAYNLCELATEDADDPQLTRVRELKAWLATFVSHGPRSNCRQQQGEEDWEVCTKALQQLPADTQ